MLEGQIFGIAAEAQPGAPRFSMWFHRKRWVIPDHSGDFWSARSV